MPALDPIRYVVYASHLSSDDSTDPDAYARQLAAALRQEYPGREVTVTIQRRVQGVGSGLQGEPEGVDPGLVQWVAERVLTGRVCSAPDCGRVLGAGSAHGLCAAHQQQRRRHGTTRPIRQPAAARVGVRLSARALSALGPRPAVRAREVIEEWASTPTRRW